ncbi:MAG: oligosaccharide flippase family protein [Oscillospiraceae bacterium]|nr:oligosaccharide flippase family protein [Oscillospiraceae bacterium]
MRRNILRDTLLLTAIQMLLDGLSLLLNVVLTARLGTEAIGLLTLTGSFFRLAAMIAGGNVFLCVSRFVSEELGKRERDPGGMLRQCLGVSLVLSAVVSGLLVVGAPLCSRWALQTDGLDAPVRRIALFLPMVTAAGCLKGWYNACCRAGTCAAADGIEFAVHAAWMLVTASPGDPETVCMTAVHATAAGLGAQLLFLLCGLPRCRQPRTGAPSLTLGAYLRLAVPVMAGSALTAGLSAANDALVPMTLRQAGSSAAEAFSQFGIFEAIILPTLFFPSTILCSLAGILVTETARARGAGEEGRIRALTEKTLRQTIVFSVFVTMLLLLFGDELGILLGGGETAGRMIVWLAPVVPFIYLEIVLESIIKGLGAQGFSSVNYLCEYVIRITVVLICIPLMGFWGIVLSYYASNVCGNTARIVLVLRRTGIRLDVVRMLGIPLFSAVLGAVCASAAFTLLRTSPGATAAAMVLYAALCGSIYLAAQHWLFRLYQGRDVSEMPPSASPASRCDRAALP